MTLTRRFLAATPLLITALAAGPAEAAWDNVFQVTCFRCRQRSTSNFTPVVPVIAQYPPPATSCYEPCPPQPVCTTRMEQRCYYQHVTRMETRTETVPVVSYQTNYVWEPVVSFRYSCYYDPCTCSYKQVQTPVTDYRLKPQCNAVTNYVQRCYSVPVTTLQKTCCYEPVPSCCTTTPVPAPQGSAQPIAPGVSEGRLAPIPGVTEGAGARGTQDYLPPQNGMIQQGRSLRPAPARPTPPPSTLPPFQPAAPLPRARLNQIAFNAPTVEGQVVTANRAPASGVRLLFVGEQGGRQTVTVDDAGKFQANLPTGKWLVYVQGDRGAPVFDRKVDVAAHTTAKLTVLRP